MPRHQRSPHARRRPRPHVRFAVLGLVASAAVLLAVPALVPGGSLLDLRGAAAGPDVIAQPPTAGPARTPAAAAAARPAVPAAQATPRPMRAPAGRPIDLGVDAPRPAHPAVTVLGGRPLLATLEGYRWPIAHPRLTLPFGPTPWGSRLVDGESFHDGVDLATFCGDRISAAHDGVVIAAGRRYDDVMGWVGDLGPYLARLDGKQLWSTLPIVVVIDDGNRYRSIYAHFSKIVVRRGDVVRAGDLLGYEGDTGRASGCHLHYGLFSPYETATFRIRPDVVKRMKVPREQIARVDPLLVLPPKPGINAPKGDRGASPSPAPSPSPSPSPSPATP